MPHLRYARRVTAPEALHPDQDCPDYDWLYARTRSGRARGPGAARELLDRLGRPDGQFRSVRVIGTNGKGSTCAMLEAGLLAAGQRVGRFTSPHLHAYEERIRTGSVDLAPHRTAQFIRWAKRHAPDAAFFDLTLALAAQTFAEDHVELAVMEAGVGGLSDATQALRNVAAVCITNVALDHTGVLGQTTAEIARDKAGAALPGIPLLTTATGEALAVIARVAAETGAPLYTPPTHHDLFALPHAPALAGRHQLQNAALAVATLRLLGADAGVRAALQATHPGRLERFSVGGRVILLDGAHNPHATAAVAGAVGPVDVLLFGNLARKDTHATLAPLLALAPRRVYTSPGTLATPPHALAAQYGGQAVPDMDEAVRVALALTPAGGTLLITGSLYLAGHLRAHLQRGS